MDSRWYCVAPFRQVYIDNKGVSPCCQYTRADKDLKTWFSSQELRSIQDQLLSNQIPKLCESCVRDENAFGQSLRTQSNQDYDNKIFTDTKMNFVDYRANNICNFKCRSCSPTFSNGISNETARSRVLQKFFRIEPDKVARVDQSNFAYIIENLDQIDRLMFTGGEPTKMPEVKSMLEQVIKRAGDRIGILITTNGSFTESFWYELVDKIPNLHWTLSLDAVGSAAEIIRHGTHWPTVEKNAKWLAKNASSLMVNSVVTNISLFQLNPLLKFVAELQNLSNGINGCSHRFHVSSRPYMMSADNLAQEKLQQAVLYLEHCLQQTNIESQQNMLTGLIAQIKIAKFDQHLWSKSQEYNQCLDQIRAENYQSLFEPCY
jgi:organic radical activating enzyme